MPTRKEIVTLDDRDRAILDAALQKAPVEKLLVELRRYLNEDLETVKALRRSSSVDHAATEEARQVLRQRIERVQLLGDELVDPAVREEVIEPLRAAIRLCDEIAAQAPGGTLAAA